MRTVKAEPHKLPESQRRRQSAGHGVIESRERDGGWVLDGQFLSALGLSSSGQGLPKLMEEITRLGDAKAKLSDVAATPTQAMVPSPVTATAVAHAQSQNGDEEATSNPVHRSGAWLVDEV